MISLDLVAKSFGDRAILNRVSLDIGPGSQCAITGVSGCGKTTLLRLVAGLDTPDEGAIHIDGELASAAGAIVLPPHRRSVGFVFQTPALWPHMTVAQNILFGLGGLTKNAADDRLRCMMSETGTLHLANRFPEALSGGEQRRVAIARTLAPEPRILLMDEPLTSLDHQSKKELAVLIRDMTLNRAVTLIYVTHDEEEAEFFGVDRFVMENAALRAAGRK